MSTAPVCQCDAPRCERDGCQDAPTVYRCHECGGTLQPSVGRSDRMLYCLRCRKRRRVPTHPALVSVGR